MPGPALGNRERKLSMVEIVFGDSAAGSLKMAQGFGKGGYIGGAVSVCVLRGDGREPAEKEIQEARKKAEEEQREAWETAAPLGGDPADVYGFSLALSIGDISGSGMDSRRQRGLEKLYSIYPDPGGETVAEELLKGAEANLREACDKAAAGEGLRVWYSGQPDELCGLYWLMDRLDGLDNQEKIFLVRLPEWEEREDGTAVQMSGWGEVGPGEWGKYLPLQRPLPSVLRRQFAARWRELQEENAPLRAVLNGQLVSVREDIYDDFIRREIGKEPEEFQEAMVIGRVLGKYQLGIGDALLAHRIEAMIAAGELEPVTQPPEDKPVYHRVLRKKKWENIL